MAPTSTALTKKVESGSPYQLSHDQVLKASTALLAHMKSAVSGTGKPSLLAEPSEEDSEENTADSIPVWLILTTKTHIIPKTRLKPSKITLPHPLNLSSTSTICLITADPQRLYKDLVTHPSFPSTLGSRITKVVGVDKIKKKWTQYEAQRKLFAEHDLFLADERIITLLPKLLGKTFYKSTTKRPIPVVLAAAPERVDGKRVKTDKSKPASEKSKTAAAATPQQVAKEIEKALRSTLVPLAPSTQTSVKVGYAHWAPEKLAQNVVAAVDTCVDRFVGKGWRGVRSVHVKGPETASLPVWLADELWESEEKVLEEGEPQEVKANVGKKRKVLTEQGEATESAKEKKRKVVKESNDDKLDEEIKARKESLRRQKEEASKGVVDEVPQGSKDTKVKAKKGKKAAAS